MRLITDVFKYCGENVPRWNTISISGYHIREAGSTASQELAFTLADGIAYVQAALERGMDIDAFVGRFSFMFTCHNNLFEEVAKFRAARRLWAKIMAERFKAKDPRSCMLRYHVQTSGSTLTAQQPMNNIVRATIQTLATILGGNQSLAVCSYDEALTIPSEESVQLSLRTQQILAYESGVADTVDPLAGSYLVEGLTNALEQQVAKYLDRIEEMGGALAAIEKGFMQREIQESSYRYQQEVESGKRVVVGVNKFVSPYPKLTDILRVDPVEAQKQVQRLAAVKARRNQTEAKAALKELERVAKGTENTMPAMLRCAEAYCSIGETCQVLRGVFGEQKEFLVF
jgi:methylmalonyl-CoA mutase N-terminal domain/subunit